MRKKSNKTKLTLWIDKNVVEKARKYIPNLSAFVEMKFREYVYQFERLEEMKTCRGRDSNPGPTDYESVAPTS